MRAEPTTLKSAEEGKEGPADEEGGQQAGPAPPPRRDIANLHQCIACSSVSAVSYVAAASPPLTPQPTDPPATARALYPPPLHHPQHRKPASQGIVGSAKSGISQHVGAVLGCEARARKAAPAAGC